jgi:hypothetical protein
VEICANETDLSSINPLHPPPMEDYDQSDAEKDVIPYLEAANASSYILFTEECLGRNRNSPFENIRKYIEAGKREGRYW